MKKLLVIATFFSFLTACSSKLATNIDFNSDTNFQVFTSYQYRHEADTSIDANPVMINRIQTAVDKILAAKGLTKHHFVDKHSADLTIHVSFSEREDQSDSSLSIGIGTSTMGRHSRASIGLSTSVPINGEARKHIKIIIDMSDINKVIWHGTDSYQTSDNLSLEQKNQEVYSTVSRLLATFPPEKVTIQK